MENKSEKKNISPRAPCEYCKKVGAVSNAKNHQKSKACIQARNGSGTPKNSPEVTTIYKNNNDKRKEKLIATIGADALKEKYRLSKAAYRLKQKQKTSPVKDDDKEKSIQEEFIDKIAKDSDSERKTIKIYVNNFFNIGEKYTNKAIDLKILDWLKDYNSVYKYINSSVKNDGSPYKDTSKKVHLESLGFISKYLGNDFSTASEKYFLLAINYNKNHEKKSKDNTMTESQKLKSIPFEELQKLESKLNKTTDSQIRTVFGLYILIPTRRAEDFRLMKLKIKKNKKDRTNDDDLEEGYNYLICSMNGLPTRMVFKSYKTYWKYKTYIIPAIPTRLANIIQEYIKDRKLSTNDFLISSINDKTKPMNQGNYSTLISHTLEKVTKKHIDINSIRSSYSTYITNNKNLTENELENIALSMGTSVDKMRTTYRKVE